MIIANIFCFIFLLFETVIEKSDIEKYLTDFVLNQGKYSKQNVIIEFTSIPDKIVVKEQNVTLAISDFSNLILRGNVTLPLDVISSGKIAKRSYISMKIRTFDSVYVALRNLRQNEVISTENVQKKWLETTQMNRQEAKSDAECLGKRVTKYITGGQPLTINFIENLPIINKGRSVQIRAKVNSIIVSTQGIATQDGRIGDIIFVKNSSNGSKLRGIVRDENTIDLIR
jgi:flagella basal body P-ring formation protein FlgA